MSEAGPGVDPRSRPQGHGGWRRVVAVVVLVGGGVLAWRQATGGATELNVALLMTHVIAGQVDDGNGRARLRRVQVLVPRQADSDEIGWTHTLDFGGSGAPEVAAKRSLKVPEGVRQLGVRCAFDIGGQQQLVTHGTATVDPGRGEELQVVDIGACNSATPQVPAKTP